MIIIICLGMLLLSFIIHLLWWRIKMPSRTTGMLLLIFLSVPAILFALGLSRYITPDTTYSLSRLLLLYSTCSLVYVILYSAIEQQSPTLGMVSFINKHSERGCDDEALMLFLNAGEEIKKRLNLMQQSGWVIQQGQRWHLTKNGKRIAQLFQAAASIFGIKRGG